MRPYDAREVAEYIAVRRWMVDKIILNYKK